ncbi:Guanylate kinase (EC [Olavius sp. associated proteobacterium Delta 1]|nr:Guanylate kinase (EC [Olavius sp. associated proteobacterium Delta 1]
MSKQYSQKVRTNPTSSVPDRPGLLFILSAPSGAGKSTICRAVLDHFPDMLYSISYTTRPPRKGEQDGVHYYFIAEDDFTNGIERGRWAEWAKVHDNYYGTSADLLDRVLNGGQDIILDIDVQGMRQILNRYPAGITIFIMPPSLQTLRSRLEARGTDSPEVIALRLKNAQAEMAQKELYRHVIINDQLADAIAELIGIIEKCCS